MSTFILISLLMPVIAKGSATDRVSDSTSNDTVDSATVSLSSGDDNQPEVDVSSLLTDGPTPCVPVIIKAGDASSFDYAVLADPQGFRLMSGGDPNSESANGEEGKRINTNLVRSLNTSNATTKLAFGIINGDITEFGRANSWKAFFRIYNNMNFSYLFGLGNHDYQSNAANCFDSNYMTIDGCAIRSVSNMVRQFYHYKNNIKLKNFSADWTDGRGSMAYSWGYGGVHFVQLQNHPNYQVRLNGTGGNTCYDIIPSLTWLSDELRKARLRGIKNIILNMHEYRDHFTRSSNAYARQQFQAIMLTYKPLAVFVGHTHYFLRRTHTNDSFYGNTTVYTTGRPLMENTIR
ncbi:metallophosphoesterase [Erwinia psidii]|uniref:Calcineurin-like phosphoesterase domain-containing protein n=1 Tax=Erwinia psidii TaxID=69224 RepID=A0A3N6V4U9_9GAMM|nr:metallophosphoesterase [Erwinia psidii]RQM40155.1 hypothetical protein EB241_02390 [Erwinia psidii]